MKCALCRNVKFSPNSFNLIASIANITSMLVIVLHLLQRNNSNSIRVLKLYCLLSSEFLYVLLFSVNFTVTLRHVSQGKEHPHEKQRIGAVQQPERAAHRSETPHPLHSGPCKRCEHGQRYLGRFQLFSPSAAVQRTQCSNKHISHNAGHVRATSALCLYTCFTIYSQ